MTLFSWTPTIDTVDTVDTVGKANGDAEIRKTAALKVITVSRFRGGRR
jgi:hypothetical protein